MQPHQTAFVELALAHDVLRFGEFTLKSGRVSPYFFNLGLISTGGALARLAESYAAALDGSGLDYDLIFGPAYKGIPLAAAVATSLAARGRDLGFAYNRKEVKDHGEGGVLVGASVQGRRVVIIDDVLTAGTALRQAVALVREHGGDPVAAVIALDREERGNGALSAVQEAEAELGLRVIPLVSVREVMSYLQSKGLEPGAIDAMRQYQQTYGIS
jgi:orotate phosphoribosyltransferase